MHIHTIVAAIFSFAHLASTRAVTDRRWESPERLLGRRADNSLQANSVSAASAKTGQEPGTKSVVAGQSPSAKDANNFINFCSGKTITNGLQNTAGSCNPIVMGEIPASNKMISAIITNPGIGQKIPADQTFTVSVQTQNLDAGFFTNPAVTYYSAPQALNSQGQVVGHCHITIQNIGSFNALTPPDPANFTFFKGIDDNGNGKGLLSAVVTGGLPTGVYRVCTIISAQNHQSVLMPVAQRGAQDDCTKFEVTGGGGTDGDNKPSSSTSTAAAVQTTSPNSNPNNRPSGGGGGKGNGGGGGDNNNNNNNNQGPDNNNDGGDDELCD